MSGPSAAAMVLGRWECDGAVFPLPALNPERLRASLRALEELEARRPGRVTWIGQPHLAERWAWDLALEPGIVDVVASILGPEVLVYATLILTKPPRDPSLVTWHQDGGTSGFNRAPCVSAWIALRDSLPESGCMRVIPGSHALPQLPHVQSRAAHHLLPHNRPEIAVEVDEGAAVDVALRAGEMSLHHANIVHGSRENRTCAPRTGFIVRYVTPAIPAARDPVVRARGSLPCPHLAVRDRPPAPDELMPEDAP
ncbi:MAG: phytanoyl-CoA dioxygenase family protein [Deltaproteobacteria bacterium]|nr:MAG: phytanoyl-CoA dioxygenase family protein [Deltaproteobacteria bacterium]TMQ12430.1 MAG: phytanoyl-CoA dioxygenase family protein [Deltaproteobacteria bacterium]